MRRLVHNEEGPVFYGLADSKLEEEQLSVA